VTGEPFPLPVHHVDAGYHVVGMKDRGSTRRTSPDYSEIRDKFRPGHADFTYFEKYGIRDFRGGGRSSARETATRVAAGAIARKVVPTIEIRGALVQVGPHAIDRNNWDWAEVERNPFFCPDAEAARAWEAYLDGVRKAGSSCGAVIEVVASGVPAGLGAPIYAKLDQDLASALMSINAVKGVEIGAGFASAALSGEENADEIRMAGNKPVFQSNHAGGILGGISTGQEVVARQRDPHGGQQAGVPVEPCRRHPWRHIDRPGGGRPLRGQADLVDPQAPPDGHPRRGGLRDHHQGPARPVRRHPGRAGGRGHGRLRAGRPLSAASRAGGRAGVAYPIVTSANAGAQRYSPEPVGCRTGSRLAPG
jgi:hypothetical protein